jgi:hypothetical protein
MNKPLFNLQEIVTDSIESVRPERIPEEVLHEYIQAIRVAVNDGLENYGLSAWWSIQFNKTATELQIIADRDEDGPKFVLLRLVVKPDNASKYPQIIIWEPREPNTTEIHAICDDEADFVYALNQYSESKLGLRSILDQMFASLLGGPNEA